MEIDFIALFEKHQNPTVLATLKVRRPDFLSTLKDGICFPAREHGQMASASDGMIGLVMRERLHHRYISV